MNINWGKIESVLADIFKIGTKAAAVAEPIVDSTNPGIGAVYNLAVTAAMQAEEAADEAAAKETTDAAKLVAITAAVQPYLIAAAQQAGVSSPTTAQINAYAQSVLDGLEILSASPDARHHHLATSAAGRDERGPRETSSQPNARRGGPHMAKTAIQPNRSTASKP